MVNWILVELENDILFWFLVIGFFKKKIVSFFLNENHLGFYMRYRLFQNKFCTTDGFFNLEKGFIRTNMHTTVDFYSFAI